MINCIIIDDEKKARDSFENVIHRYFSKELNVLYKAESVKDAVEAILKYNPDLVFTDIQMPIENGFKLFDYFDHYHFEVIFTTAYSEYAIEAIRYSAIDYLLKPIDYLDLKRALTEFKEIKMIESRQQRVEVLLANLSVGGTGIHNKIALPTLNGYQMEHIFSIVYCQADINYTKIYTNEGKMILVAKTLKIIEDLLPDKHFFRIHKSYLVNLNYIKSFNKVGDRFVLLENGKRLDVATRRVNEFIDALTNNRVK